MLKKSKSNSPNYKHLRAYFSPKSAFALLSPFDLETCASRFEKQFTTSGTFKTTAYPTFTALINPVDSDKYEFRLRKEEYLSANLFISGYMQRLSQDSTLITGTVKAEGYMLLPLLMFCLLLVFLWPIAIILAIWVILRRYTNKNAMIEYLTNVLNAVDIE